MLVGSINTEFHFRVGKDTLYLLYKVTDKWSYCPQVTLNHTWRTNRTLSTFPREGGTQEGTVQIICR